VVAVGSDFQARLLEVEFVQDPVHHLVGELSVASHPQQRITLHHTSMADYLEYVREPGNGYVSVSFPVADDVEISSWTGRQE
jgi:hypothetical protein